ncbi:uncharacterized protein [Panulirus ornatus]|uniref:uncharacterized protein isoform X2 n=1 Tax=Panulirus ornatus TaxID=150431 RepID=UPI003A873A11
MLTRERQPALPQAASSQLTSAVMNWKIWFLTTVATVMLFIGLVLCRVLGSANPPMQYCPLAAVGNAAFTTKPPPPPSATDDVPALTMWPFIKAVGYTAGSGFARPDAGIANVTYFMSTYLYRDVTTDDVFRNDRDKQSHFRERHDKKDELMNTSSKVSVISEGKMDRPQNSAMNITTPLFTETNGSVNKHIHDTDTGSDDNHNVNEYTTVINKDTTVIIKESKMGEKPVKRRGQRSYLANHQLGQSTAGVAPLMLASRYHYLPLKDDGTVSQVDPCPPPSPHTGSGSNVFAFLTFGVVTVNVLMNAVANVNSNNRNNNNNENNNNNNINNENVSNNLDSNMNDNTISTGRTMHNSTTSCACHGRQVRRRDTVEHDTPAEPSKQTLNMLTTNARNFILTLEQQERPEGPKTLTPASQTTLKMESGKRNLKTRPACLVWMMGCVPRLVCEAHRSAKLTQGLASLALKISGLAVGRVGVHHVSPQVLEEARVQGASGGPCVSPCSPPALLLLLRQVFNSRYETTSDD